MWFSRDNNWAEIAIECYDPSPYCFCVHVNDMWHVMGGWWAGGGGVRGQCVCMRLLLYGVSQTHNEVFC